MILTKKLLNKMCQSQHWTISTELEDYLLLVYGQSPDDYHEWSEQDIYKQIRKIILRQSSI